MPRAVADAVAALWTGVGTGNVTGMSSITGFQQIPAALSGEIVAYVIKHDVNSERESGFGVWTSGTGTLTRQFRTYPTRGGSAVTFSSGNKTVKITQIDAETCFFSTIDPTSGDDIDDGFLEGRSTWLNRTSNAFFVCVKHTSGAAVWTQIGGAGTPAALAVTVAFTPGNYIPNDSSVEGHLIGINAALTGGADATPTQSTTNAAEFVLPLGDGLHANDEVRTDAANRDYEVPVTAPAGYKWLLKPLHTGCIVSVDTNVGSVNGVAGGSAVLIKDGIAFVEVDSNPGSAPVVQVRGSVIIGAIVVGTTKTYNNDDSDQKYRLTTTATQTFGAAAGFADGFEVMLIALTGTITVAGVDASYTIVGPDIVIVTKQGPSLIASGKANGSPIILDAA